MFTIGEEVVVLKQNVCIGMGEVVAICQTIQDLNQYFTAEHPLYAAYQLSLRNHQNVYIVAFFHDLGQGGYLAHELKKKRAKREKAYA